MNPQLHKSKADGDFDEQTTTDYLSKGQNVSVMNDSCCDTNGSILDAVNHDNNIVSI